jgi:hypothetical protein
MSPLPSTVRLTLALVWLDAFIWLGFALLTAFSAHPSYGAASAYRWPMVAIAVLIAAALAGLAIWLGKQRRLAYWLALALLAALTIAPVFDQFGLADLAFVVATALPLGLLLKDRAWYLGAPGVDPEHPSA